MCPMDMPDEILKQKLADGYNALSEDNLDFANQVISIVHEVLTD